MPLARWFRPGIAPEGEEAQSVMDQGYQAATREMEDAFRREGIPSEHRRLAESYMESLNPTRLSSENTSGSDD